MRTFADACFLACSWTWCIGLWLPVYLISDFGWIGWAAFAIPNVIGAAGMGLVFRAPGASEAFVQRHGRMMRLFSIATIVFHVSFLSWLGSWVAASAPDAPDWPGPLAALILFAAAMVLARFGEPAADQGGPLEPDRRPLLWRVMAVSTLAGSALLLALASIHSGGNQFQAPPAATASTAANIAWMFPALAFGFGLCPALDLTLHRVRRGAPGVRGNVAFSLGFGVIFLALIAASGFYAAGVLATWLSFYLVGHIALQSTFTMGAHLRELREAPGGLPRGRRGEEGSTGRPSRRGSSRGATGGATPVLLPLVLAAATSGLITGVIPSRVQYMLLLGLYALPFPAYVWMVAFAGREAPRRAIKALIVVVILAAPAVWWGGIERRWPWLAAAVALPLVAGAWLRFSGPRTDESGSAGGARHRENRS